MPDDRSELTRLLRAQLTAVHQQFMHILALRQWREAEIAARIVEVDSEDFKNVMQIIDLLVSEGRRIALDAQHFTPGSDISAILRAELVMESHLAELLTDLKVDRIETAARVRRAAAPRAGYRAWLEEQIAMRSCEGIIAQTDVATAAFMARLVGLIEQAMVDAFVLWHRRDKGGADFAWRISGAAMLYTSALVRRGALTNSVPAPAVMPPMEVEADGAGAHTQIVALLGQCAVAANAAADRQGDETMARLCFRIAQECELLSKLEPSGEFPVELGSSPVFSSFAASLERTIGRS